MADSNRPDEELPLLGIDFVFDMGMKKIEEQVREIEAIDVKIGILLGFLGTVLVALLAVVFTAEPKSVALVGRVEQTFLLGGLLFVGFAICFAFAAFRVSQYFGTPRFSDLFRWANEDPKQTKWLFLDILRDAVKGNIERLESKQRYARLATWFVLFAFLSLLFAIIGVGMKIFVRI